mgnify:CR=1 FL=1
MKLIFLIPLIIIFLLSCTASDKSQNRNEQISSTNNEIVDPSFYQEKYLKGIKFFARGNEPFWSLDIYSDNKIVFSEMSEPEVVALNYKEEKSNRENEIIISAQTNNGELVVSILRDSCQDNMSGEMFDHQVSVRIKNSSSGEILLNGCGKYLYDYRLNDIWVMEELTDVVLKKENLMKGLPMFEFNLREMRVSGHAGCNQFFGKIILKGNSISFGTMASTKMACLDMTVEQKVFQALNQNSFTYKIDKLKLILESESGIKMVFRKTD